MPFYEYQCSACGHHHEELQKVTDRVLRKCPACGRSTLKKLVSAPVFRLKGGGWYETDFKADKEGQRNIAGDKEPVTVDVPSAEKPKEVKADGAGKDAGAKTGDAAKAAATDTQSKNVGAKPPPARKPIRRRRARK